ncbi:NAD(P)-binding domain-containing protein [Streptomyces collinus]|uniref:NADPH-dependent F420 reductase n=1 Tax=Streptomyces collinus TaxID=42684 RepID=UPI0036E52523
MLRLRSTYTLPVQQTIRIRSTRHGWCAVDNSLHDQETLVKIGIIGAGNVGSVLGRRFLEAGHEVTISASSPASPRLAEAASWGANVATAAEAATWAEVVLLAVPFTELGATLTVDVTIALAGKIVIDAVNPLAADFMSLLLGHTTSAGEQVAARLGRSCVVKAFNTILASNFASPELGGNRLLLPVAGDDPVAKKTVLELGKQLGFDAVDAGALTNARYLEPMAELLIQLAYGQGMGTNNGWTLTRA